MLEDMGNCVKIHETLVPAVNIQVEGAPGCYKFPNGGPDMWQGIYFEILFDNGTLWVIEQKSEPEADDTIYVVIYDRWFYRDFDTTTLRNREPDHGVTFQTWSDFLIYYRDRVEANHITVAYQVGRILEEVVS